MLEKDISCNNYTMQGEIKLTNCEEKINNCQPIYECPKENCVHREIVHEVNHICPINTRIINHHIFKHNYIPCYTCVEENDYCNINMPRHFI